jgi:hypothetical protein
MPNIFLILTKLSASPDLVSVRGVISLLLKEKYFTIKNGMIFFLH